MSGDAGVAAIQMSDAGAAGDVGERVVVRAQSEQDASAGSLYLFSLTRP